MSDVDVSGQYDAAHVDELLVVSVRGLVTVRQVMEISSSVRLALARRDARAVVIDATEAVAMLSREQWAESLQRFVRLDQPLQRPLPHPMALVVDPRYERAADAYCDHMAEHGLVRLAFTSVGPALEWASRCLVHWRHAPWPDSSRFPVVQATPPSPTPSPPQQLPAAPWRVPSRKTVGP